MTPRDADELLGAWTLVALDADEVTDVENALVNQPELAREAANLCDVLAELGELADDVPPRELRDRILGRASDLPPPQLEPTEPLEAFANQVEVLNELLSTLTEEEWRQTALPYRWSVHGLVGHLLVIERYMAGQLGLAEPTTQEPVGHVEMGEHLIADETRRQGSETATSWHGRATATIDALRELEGPHIDESVEFHGWPFTIASLLVARAFEVWTHGDDIRRATGRAELAPPAADLRAMSMLSVTSLPLVLPLVDSKLDFGGARIVLTGEGGGTFDLGHPGQRDALVVADVVDYCRLAARRIEINELEGTIEGDHQVGEALLAAARVFAV